MRERPILFSAPMVRSILDGRKTQTRRAVKRIPWRTGANPDFSQARAFSNASEFRIAGGEEMTTGFRCPYGQAGDRLWVREAFDPIYGQNGSLIEVDYRATYEHGHRMGDHLGFKKKWRPSIHMPRAASRITLEVTGVCVERLQAISEGEARAEGVEGDSHPGTFVGTCRGNFARLWESINGVGTWDANPWVWVIEFKRVEPAHG